VLQVKRPNQQYQSTEGTQVYINNTKINKRTDKQKHSKSPRTRDGSYRGHLDLAVAR